MKNLLITAAVIAAASSAACALSIRLDTTSYSASPGGEFRATPLSGSVGIVGGYASLSGDSFETFCMEYHEHFTPGHIYNVVINTAASSATEGLDPLDARTAFLYTKFRQGSLNSYSYTGEPRQTMAGQLQQAIWYIENESHGANNAYVALANAAVAVGGEWYGRGIGDVRVMNLFGEDGSYAQDQLTLVAPLPPAVSAGLAGLCGVAGMGWMRRRNAVRA